MGVRGRAARRRTRRATAHAARTGSPNGCARSRLRPCGHLPDPGELDVTALGAEPEGAGGETAAQPPAAALEPGEPHPGTSTAPGARGRPVGQGGGEVDQPGRVRLLAVVRPPRCPGVLRLVPRAAQAVRRPVNGLGELVLADAVGALGGPLLHVRPHQGQSPVVSEPLRAAMGPERLGLGVGRVQREQESPDHPTHARSDHRQNPPTEPPAPANHRPANHRQPGSRQGHLRERGRAKRHETKRRHAFRRTARDPEGQHSPATVGRNHPL
jgi:hypothetical protein